MSTPFSDADRSADAANAALFAGALTEAEANARAALALNPAHAGALALLGSALHAQGRFAEAEGIFLRLTDLHPHEGMYWMNVATARRCAGRLEEALFAFARAAALGADSADFYYNLGLTHIDRNDFESARAVLAKAVQRAPRDAEIRFRYAFCCYECLQTDEALKALDGWEQLPPASSDIMANTGHLLMKLGESARAEPTVRRAAMDPSSDPQAMLTLIQVLERTNRLAEAREFMDRLVAEPRAAKLGVELISMQAQLAQREGHHESACALLTQARRLCKEEHEEHFHCYPLAKSLDALGRHEDAFEILQAAHRSQLAHLKLTAPLQVTRGAPVLGITRFSCEPSDVVTWSDADAPSAEDSPIFIVAFPRSGTTLLELTLDAHPRLQSMDEQPFLQNALDDMIDQGVKYPHQLGRLGLAQLNGVRARYWERVRRKVSLQHGQRLVDKNPLNMLRLPVIRRLFPNARILLAIRHPCDVLLSCYMQHFRAPDFAMLCMDLPGLAQGYRQSFDFWYQQHELLQPCSMELRYETLVQQFEDQVRAMVQFLRLPWTDQMLEPGTHAREKRFISTPSYSQVVKPVNNKAVGRWRAYERHFATALPVLMPYLRRWNYDVGGG